MSTEARVHRARVAALSRHREASDCDLIEARLRLKEEAFLAAIRRAVAIAPPMTPTIQQRVTALVTNSETAT